MTASCVPTFHAADKAPKVVVAPGTIAQLEFNTMRATMRRFWCAFWEHAHEVPCVNDAFLKKLKLTKHADARSKLAMEHKEAAARDKTHTPERMKQEFWYMFDGFCTYVSNSDEKTHICENPLMLKAKRGNRMPPVS